MARKIEEPVTVKNENSLGGTITSHPSFAQIGASRVQGGVLLYGSDFQHQNYITIRIASSKLHRSLSRDWHSESSTPYVEVALSEAQWATFVSSMNQGSGTCCTATFLNGAYVNGLPPNKSRKAQYEMEANQNLIDARENLEKLAQAIGESKLSKKEKEEMVRLANFAYREIGSSMDFVMKQFGEFMESTTEKAKIEVNAYTTSTLMRAGLDAVKAGSVQLLKGGE